MARIVIRARLTRAQARQVIRRLPAVLAGKGGDAAGAVTRLNLLLGMTALQFIKQAFVERAAGDADESGLRWAPLAESTVRGRRKGSGEGVPDVMRDTGRLLNSFSPGNPQNVLEARPGSVVVGTNVAYARYLHEGIPGRMPARPLWPDPRNWPSRWNAAILDALRQGIVRLIREQTGAS